MKSSEKRSKTVRTIPSPIPSDEHRYVPSMSGGKKSPSPKPGSGPTAHSTNNTTGVETKQHHQRRSFTAQSISELSNIDLGGKSQSKSVALESFGDHPTKHKSKQFQPIRSDADRVVSSMELMSMTELSPHQRTAVVRAAGHDSVKELVKSQQKESGWMDEKGGKQFVSNSHKASINTSTFSLSHSSGLGTTKRRSSYGSVTSNIDSNPNPATLLNASLLSKKSAGSNNSDDDRLTDETSSNSDTTTPAAYMGSQAHVHKHVGGPVVGIDDNMFDPSKITLSSMSDQQLALECMQMMREMERRNLAYTADTNTLNNTNSNTKPTKVVKRNKSGDHFEKHPTSPSHTHESSKRASTPDMTGGRKSMSNSNSPAAMHSSRSKSPAITSVSQKTGHGHNLSHSLINTGNSGSNCTHGSGHSSGGKDSMGLQHQQQAHSPSASAYLFSGIQDGLPGQGSHGNHANGWASGHASGHSINLIASNGHAKDDEPEDREVQNAFFYPQDSQQINRTGGLTPKSHGRCVSRSNGAVPPNEKMFLDGGMSRPPSSMGGHVSRPPSSGPLSGGRQSSSRPPSTMSSGSADHSGSSPVPPGGIGKDYSKDYGKAPRTTTRRPSNPNVFSIANSVAHTHAVVAGAGSNTGSIDRESTRNERVGYSQNQTNPLTSKPKKTKMFHTNTNDPRFLGSSSSNLLNMGMHQHLNSESSLTVEHQMSSSTLNNTVEDSHQSLPTLATSVSFDSHSVGGGSISSSGTDWSSIVGQPGHKTVAVKVINTANATHSRHQGDHSRKECLSNRQDWENASLNSNHSHQLLNSPVVFTSHPQSIERFSSVTSLTSLASTTSISSLTNAIKSDSRCHSLMSQASRGINEDDDEDAIARAGGLDNLLNQNRTRILHSPSSAFDELSVGSGSLKTTHSSRSGFSSIASKKDHTSSPRYTVREKPNSPFLKSHK